MSSILYSWQLVLYNYIKNSNLLEITKNTYLTRINSLIRIIDQYKMKTSPMLEQIYINFVFDTGHHVLQQWNILNHQKNQKQLG